MKKRILMIVMFFGSLTFSPAIAQTQAHSPIEIPQAKKEAKFVVFGNCGMCKNRIEKAVGKLEGVETVNWDKESKYLTATYDPSKVKETEIHEQIISVGHDTEDSKAADKVYNSLPGCCQYERSSK